MSTDGVVSAADQLQERLTDPRTMAGLNRLLDHLDTINFAVDSMEGFIGRGEVIADSVASSVGDLKALDNEQTRDLLRKTPGYLATGRRLADAAGDMDVDQLAQSKVLQRLTDPETLVALNQLLDQLPLAAFLLDSLEGFIARGETIADNLADGVKELRSGESSFDPAQLTSLLAALPKFREAGEKLLNSDLMGEGLPKVIDAGVSMVDSGMLDKQVVAILGELGKKSAETYQEVNAKPIQPIGGMWATLKATKDPDVQKTMGFFFAFAKAFAKHLG